MSDTVATSRLSTEALWLDLLECQTELTLPLELPHFYASEAWMAAPVVLDLGAGPGYHLNALARVFPKTAYIGVDVEPNYITVARSQASPSTRFTPMDLFETSGSYPCVLSRLVAQHLPSLPAFLDKVHGLLEPGGCFVSIEPADHLRKFYPPLPAVQAVFAAYTSSRRDSGFDRHAGLSMGDLAAAHGLRVESAADVVVPSCLPGHKRLFARFHEVVLRLFDEVFGVSFPAEDVSRELRQWAADHQAYAQLGIRLAVYRRV
jgi:SAM-dependent methyltransferase